MAGHDDELKARFLDFLRSRKFNPYLKTLAGRPYGRYFRAAVSAMTVFGIPFAAYEAFKILRHRADARRRLIRVAERSVPLMTYPLMANQSLGERPGSVAPGLVIGSFDPRANTSTDFMMDVATDVLMAEGEEDGPEAKVIVDLFENQDYTEGRRRRLPMALTRGIPVYAFDLMIVGDYLPNGRIDVPMIPCVAEPGPTGRILMVPWFVAADPDGRDEAGGD